MVHKGSQTYAKAQIKSKVPIAKAIQPAPVSRIMVKELPAPEPVKVAKIKEPSYPSIRFVATPTPKITASQDLAKVIPRAKPQMPQQWYASKQSQSVTRIREGFIWPLRGKIISTFGTKESGYFNDGINIAAPKGKAISAVADGEVVYAGNELEGYGNMIILRHNNGWMSAYAHTGTMNVSLGHKVSQGQAIAKVGDTGDVDVPQLHFALRKDQQSVNPMDFLSDNLAAVY